MCWCFEEDECVGAHRGLGGRLRTSLLNLYLSPLYLSRSVGMSSVGMSCVVE